MLLYSFTSWLFLGPLALAGTIPLQADPLPRSDVLEERQDGACTNTARTRNCWSNGYSIATDFDAKSPPDGVEVTVSRLLRRLY